jgi:hypothetical protein
MACCADRAHGWRAPVARRRRAWRRCPPRPRRSAAAGESVREPVREGEGESERGREREEDRDREGGRAAPPAVTRQPARHPLYQCSAQHSRRLNSGDAARREAAAPLRRHKTLQTALWPAPPVHTSHRPSVHIAPARQEPPMLRIRARMRGRAWKCSRCGARCNAVTPRGVTRERGRGAARRAGGGK